MDEKLSGTCKWTDEEEELRHPIQGLSDVISGLLLLGFAAYGLWLVFGSLALAVFGD